MKVLVWVFWLATLVLTLIAVSGVLPATSWLTQELYLLSTISSLVGVLLFLGSTLVILLVGSKASSKLVVRSVLGRPINTRRLGSNSLAVGMREAFIQSLEDPRSNPNSILAIAVSESGCQTPVWPWDLSSVAAVVSDYQSRVQRSLVLRLLLPDIGKALANNIEQTLSFLEELAALGEVEKEEFLKTGIGKNGQKLFSEWVSSKTGALVLADGAHTRAGYPKNIRVLNLGNFRNSTSYSPKETYFSTHVGPLARCDAGAKMREQSKTLADDYDGRVLDLVATAVVRNPLRSGVELLMITGESCYAATEVDPDLRCKDLTAGVELGIGFSNSKGLKFEASSSRNRRTCLVTVTALVISESVSPGGSTQSNIILLRRPKEFVVRNGSDVSAPPGGVVNISSDSKNANPTPDLHEAIREELQEEMGLELQAKSIAPFGVFIVNERGPKGRSQLVATAGFIARTSMSVDEIRSKHSEASNHEGKYESISYDVIPLPEPRQLETLSEDEKGQEAEKFALAILEFANVIDQTTVVATMYLSAELFGKQLTTEAFDRVWEKPWQQMDWRIDSFPGLALGRLATSVR
jgi:ADP-ribose pyrophosphatase YjhB (NUDIX family)